MAGVVNVAGKNTLSLHGLGVICGLTAGVWLGAAEAPTKLVNAGFSPFAISLCMVAGVFTARWTFPTLLKGTCYVFADLAEKKHLIVWALLAGALWAVANTLTVFAIRDVGLAVAFPLWNANALVGLFWGWLLFRELDGASAKNIGKVVFGGVAILIAAVMLGFSTIHGGGQTAQHGVRGHHCGCRREPDVGNHVRSVSQGLSQRNESSVVCYCVYRGRTGHSAGSYIGPGRRDALASVSIASSTQRRVLAVPGRICLGDWRFVSAIRSEVSGNRTWNSLVEYESIVGLGLGRSRIRGTGHG